MSKTEQQIYNRSLAPSRENDLSSKTYELIRGKLEEKFGSNVEIFLQGSYANRTNIKKDSDIDIVICYKDSYFYNIDELSEDDKNLFKKNSFPATYNFSTFKDDVEIYLRSIYGNIIERKNKCIKIPGNGSRVDADIVPCFVYKRFSSLSYVSAEGIKLISDEGQYIANFPKQHKDNGKQKNQLTNENYKGLVRVIKNCKKELIENNTIVEDLVSSFLLECIVRNLPNSIFTKSNSFKDCLNEIISTLYNDMRIHEKYYNYAEVCDLFYLLRGGRVKETPEEIRIFLEKAYNLINY